MINIKRVILITFMGVIVLLLSLISFEIKSNIVERINKHENVTNEEHQNINELEKDEDLYQRDEENQNDNEMIIDPRLPEGSVNMIIKHYKSMDTGDVELFKSTLVPEDGGDSNIEPNTMKTFEEFNKSGVYIKEIWLYNDALPSTYIIKEDGFSQLIKVVIWNPKENNERIYFLAVTNVKDWGVSRYVSESQLD